jgi:nitrous oxidase accessory protein
VRRLVCVLALVAGAAAPALARTWTVGRPGSDFPLIAPAVAAASDGDVVLVRGGVYREDVVIGRSISLLGEQAPVLVGTGEGSVVEVRAAHAEIRGFTIEGSGAGETNRMDAGVRIVAPGARVLANRMRRVFYGIVVEGVSGCELAGNEIAGFEDRPFGQRGDGIYLYRAPDNLVRENRIRAMRDGIYLQYSPRCRALDNVVEASRYGLHDMFSDDETLAGNVFRDCSVGANIMNCRRVSLRSNRFERNRGVSSVGLSLKECDDSRIEGNRVMDNARGLQIEGSSKNRFVGNRLAYNDVALCLFPSAEENVFTENDFLDNWSAVVLAGTSTSTRFAENGRGNRWSGYKGFDFEGRGTGSSPHPLLGAFEKLEGNNPAARLFLQSPAAQALELAARSALLPGMGPVDPAPLVRRPALTGSASGRRAQIAAGALLLVAFAFVAREARSCSKSKA